MYVPDQSNIESKMCLNELEDLAGNVNHTCNACMFTLDEMKNDIIALENAKGGKNSSFAMSRESKQPIQLFNDQ